MVPRTHLIVWTALVVLPFSVIGVLSPAGGMAALAAIGVFLALAISDAVLGAGARGVVGVQLPPLVRLQKDRPGVIEMELLHEGAAPGLVRIGLAFPAELHVSEEERLIALPAHSPRSRLEWACTAAQRGQFWLREVFLETRSPLGFWAFRTRHEAACEMRVYPNLHEERRHVAALFLRRGRVGVHAQRSAGQGREFEKLRDYVPGDSMGDIHWKVSARRGTPVTKIYQVERTHEVYVVIDASRLAARPLREGEPGSVALERYVSAALLLAFAAEQQGDQFGLITFGDRVGTFVRARSGSAHFDVCRERLYALQPHDVSPDFEELFTLIRLRLRRRALVIVLTALDDPVLAESFVNAAALVSRQHLLYVNLLQAPGVAPLFSGGEPAQDVAGIYRALSGHLQWQKLRELQMVLQRRGVKLSFLEPEQLAAALLAQHADVRARQLV